MSSSMTLRFRRSRVPLAAALALCACLPACERAAPSATASPTPPAASAPAPAAPPASAPAADGDPLVPAEPAVPVPDGGQALAAAYGLSGNGPAERALPDGRQARFWAGYAYRSRGEDRYTAFVHAVAPAEGGMAPPGQQVDLAQVTYVLRDGAWRPGPAQTDVGRFGATGRAPAFDAARIALTYTVSADEALLALPSAMTATGGARVEAYEVFRYAAGDGSWHHAGTVRAGVDQSAGCPAGAATPATACVRNRGGLRFLPAAAGAFPDIRVTFRGSVRGDDGAIREAGAADDVTYRYDSGAGGYAETPAP
ncbi:MAG: hypothetical protein ACTHOH_14735 [Lysobacteraceae bacterium]